MSQAGAGGRHTAVIVAPTWLPSIDSRQSFAIPRLAVADFSLDRLAFGLAAPKQQHPPISLSAAFVPSGAINKRPSAGPYLIASSFYHS